MSWSGGGTSGNWGDIGNWGFAGTPTNGDILIFVAGQPRPSNTNNISNLTLNQIRIVGTGGGYALYGNTFTLTNGIECTNSAGSHTINNSIVLASADATVDVTVGLSLNGALSGSVGLAKTGVGILTFAGSLPNTYSGTTRVDGGTLVLNRGGSDDAIPGPLIVGNGVNLATVQLAQAFEIGDSVPITVNQSATLDVNSKTEDIGSLNMAGGTVTTGTGTLTLASGSTFAVIGGLNSAISGNLNIGSGTCIWTQAPLAFVSISATVSGSANIIDNGMGQVNLTASNTFTGTLTINGGFVGVLNSWALGTTNNGTIVNEPGTIGFFGGNINVPGEPLTLNSSVGYQSLYTAVYAWFGGSNSWLGPVTLGTNVTVAIDSGTTFNFFGAISGGSFGLTKSYPGTLYYGGTNANTYTGNTIVTNGTLVLNKTIANGAIAGNVIVSGTGTLRLNNNEEVVNTADVLVNSGGVFDFGSFFESINTLHGNGSVTFGNLGYLKIGGAGGSSTFDGIMSGIGYPGGYTIGKSGSGTFTMNGNNTHSNGLAVFGGKLLVNGIQPQTPVIEVDSGTTLGGSGAVGNILDNGTISPGNSPGILSTSNLILTGTSVYLVELNGANPGTGYDQLIVHGTNFLAGTLALVAGGGFSPVEGSPITILDNDGSDPIGGIFVGLPEGSITTLGALKFRISYAGGTGNDVTLTLTNPPAQVLASSVAAGNGDTTIDAGECNSLFLTITNTTVTPLTGVTATLSTTTAGAVIPQITVPYSDVPVGGKGTNTLPFQLTTQPWFVPGTDISLVLTISSSAGSFSTSFTVATGGTGSAVQFKNTTPMAIPDLSTNFSTLNVSGFTSAVAQITVSINISHTYDSDLDVYLIAPDATTISLTRSNGASGDNYGTACANPTVFDDTAGTAITAGIAPFVGTFRPEQPLFTFRGVNPNGVWTLRVSDHSGGDVGTLNCWSLSISPYQSSNGGGVCDLCPNVTLSSAIGINNPVQSDRIIRNGQATSCAFPTGCPGGAGFDSPYYDTYTFRNGPSDACITVTLTSSLADVFSAAYLGSYDPANLCNNYIGDSGDSTFDTGGTASYSFSVASNATFVVEVNDIFGGTGPYRLSVTGGDCRPVLNINPAGTNVLLNWTTAAAGYQLEQTNSLPAGTNWSSVPALPAIVGGKYQVTNGVLGTSNQFYRLRKSVP